MYEENSGSLKLIKLMKTIGLSLLLKYFRVRIFRFYPYFLLHYKLCVSNILINLFYFSALLCRQILIYKQDNNLSTKEVAERIDLTNLETEDILFF